MPVTPRQIPTNTQFNNYRVMYELTIAERHSRRHRWFRCQCDCGVERDVRIDNLGKVVNCIECSKKYDHLYKQVPRCRRNIQDSHAYESWFNMINKSETIPLCEEWRDFSVYINFYMKSTGLTLEDILKDRYERSFYHAERINKEVGWEPDNTTFIRFVTERARDKPTYTYWYRLKCNGMLEESVMAYKDFVTSFGLKDGKRILRRRDINFKHSKTNSYWYIRNDR